jgi:hypothetical protein
VLVVPLFNSHASYVTFLESNLLVISYFIIYLEFRLFTLFTHCYDPVFRTVIFNEVFVTFIIIGIFLWEKFN